MAVDLSAQAIPAAKHAETLFDVIPPIRNRWSPRSYLEKPVPAVTLKVLLDAARWAASCFNEQPWRFIVATKESPAEYARLLSVLAEKNQQWAKFAPVLMLSVGKKTFSHNGKPNRHGFYDTGAAIATMSIQAASMGLETHSMAGYDPEKARQLFGIPDDFEPGAAITVGYPGPASAAPPDFQAGETAKRERKSLKDLVFTTRWGTSLELQ